MKNITRTVVLAIVLTVVVLPAMAEDFDFEARGDHYLVVSEVSQANADQMLDRMEAFLALYNRQFRFRDTAGVRLPSLRRPRKE